MATGRLLRKDFEDFQKEVKKWQDILGLQNWEIHCIFGDCHKSNRAEFVANPRGRVATIWLNNMWSEDAKSKEMIRKTAFHEVAEIWLQDLVGMASIYVSEAMVEVETHKIVKTLENVLFPKY